MSLISVLLMEVKYSSSESKPKLYALFVLT